MIPDLPITFGGKHLAEVTVAQTLPWAQVVALFKPTPPEELDKSAQGWYAFALFKPQYRHSDNLVGRSALTLDYDHITRADVPKIMGILAPYAYVGYTTFSHTKDAPRLRIIVPLSRLAIPDEFIAVSRRVASWAGIELASGESHVPAQMMFMPARKPGSPFRVDIGASTEPLDVDAILATYTDWRDRNSWPRRASGDEINPGEIPPAPDTKPGIVGDFCRAFTIPEAIERFDLPYTRVSDDRWTYTHGSRPEGAVLYDGGLKLHSHHDTDPARGQHNAYDLVRLHRFVSLDAEVPADTPITELPSYKAMAKLAREQPEVMAAHADAEFEEIHTPNLPIALKPDAERFRVIPAEDFANGPPMEWVIPEVLPRAELAVGYGEPGSGKSFFFFDMLCAISRGIEWRGLTVKKGRGVYVAAEGAGGFRSRLRAYAVKHKCDLNTLPGVIADAPNLTDAADAAAVASQILKLGKIEVLVIDTLSATTPGANENSGEDMGQVIAHCKFLHRKTGALVILIHHSGKDASRGARGWSGLKGAADAEFEISRMGETRLMRVSKMKDGQDGRTFAFQLETVTIGFNDQGEETSCAVEACALPEMRKSNVPTGGIQRIAWMALKTMAPDGSSVDLDDLVEGINKKLPEKKKSSELRRVILGLVAKGHAFAHGENRVSWVAAKEGEEDGPDES